ncbi:MAG: phage holin family protein [Oscillospiraceae bacterium]|nr:phage holin family protein [Oscillospiraceae bacterium]
MDFFEYIVTDGLILIPVLSIIGMAIKNTQAIPNRYIPLILLFVGILFGVFIIERSAFGAVQGILVSGAAVYGHQIYKQTISKEE